MLITVGAVNMHRKFGSVIVIVVAATATAAVVVVVPRA